MNGCNKALENLKMADKLKDEFLSRTSHELKTPLNGIIGLVDTIIESSNNKLTKEEMRNLSLVSYNGKLLLYLINDITDYSQLKHSKIILYRKPVDLRQLANVVLLICNPLLSGKKIDLINNVSGELPPVYADENRIQQILYNLVGNSIKFTEKGYIRIDAEQSVTNKSEMKIRVTDSGKGIPEDKFDDVLESFTQIPYHNVEIRGMGLGLNISKILIELHGGKISIARGDEGRGTCISFTIPIADANTIESFNNEYYKIPNFPSENTLQKPPYKEKIRHKNPSGKILIADDDYTNVEVLVSNLNEQHIDMDIVYDGLSALKKIRNEGDYDIILLDIMMPDMSGFEVCIEVRKDYSLLDLPILLLTVKNQTVDIVNGFINRANDYLSKPFRKEELHARIRILIRMKKLSKFLKNVNIKLEDKVKKRTQELERKTNTLRKTNEELKLYSSIVAHDLRSPLSIIDGYLQQILDKNLDLPFEIKKDYLKEIQNTGREMVSIIRRLLGLSIINISDLTFETVDLSEIFREAFLRFKKSDKIHNPKITIESDMSVYGDRNMIYQMIDNLLGNAWKFTRGINNPKIDIGRKEDLPSGKSVFYITDNGVGFDTDNTDELFKIYHRYQGDGYDGYGIGLGIVKRVIDLHNGKIWVESKPGKGTSFYFTL